MNFNLIGLQINKKELAIFGLFLFSAFVVRAYSFSQSVLGWDEGLYLLMARSIMAGNLPYIEVWDHKPPGVYLLFIIAQIIFGKSIVSIRVISCLAAGITSYFLYRMGKIISGNRITGLLTGIIYTIFSTNNEGLAANTEIFYSVFVTLAFYLLFTVYHANSLTHAHGKLFIIGLVIGIGLQIHYLVAFDILALLLIVGIALSLHHREIRKISWANMLKIYGLLLIGPVLLFCITALFFILNGRLSEYIQANLFANMAYGSQTNFSIVDFTILLRQQVATNALLWICLGLTPLSLIIFEDLNPEINKMISALFLWSLMALLAIGFSRGYPHHFLHFLPPACLLSAIIIIKLVYAEPKPGKRQFLLISLILLVPLLQNIYPAVEMDAALIYFRFLKEDENWGNEAVVIAKYLQDRVTPDDYIYVVDYAPTLYYLVSAKSPTRYVFPPFLNDEKNYTLIDIDPIRELASIIEKKPIYIIKQYDTNNSFYIELDRYLDNYYLFESSVNNVGFYRLQNHTE